MRAEAIASHRIDICPDVALVIVRGQEIEDFLVLLHTENGGRTGGVLAPSVAQRLAVPEWQLLHGVVQQEPGAVTLEALEHLCAAGNASTNAR